MEPDRNNVAPRFGLAWQPRSGKTTVIRAGAGIYYSEFPWLFAPYPLISPSPVSAGQSFTNSLTSPVPTYVLGVNVFPPAPSAQLTSAFAAGLSPGTQVTMLNPGFRTSYASAMESRAAAQRRPERFRGADLPGIQRPPAAESRGFRAMPSNALTCTAIRERGRGRDTV